MSIIFIRLQMLGLDGVKQSLTHMLTHMRGEKMSEETVPVRKNLMAAREDSCPFQASQWKPDFSIYWLEVKKQHCHVGLRSLSPSMGESLQRVVFEMFPANFKLSISCLVCEVQAPYFANQVFS